MTDPAALAASLGYEPPALTWPTTSNPPVPPALFGKDHWSTFAYVETRAVDYKGGLNHNHMRCHANRHPVMLGAKTHGLAASGDGSAYATRIKASTTPGEDGRFGTAELAHHDDYDCLDDLVAAGLLTVDMPRPHAGDDGGWFEGARGRVVLDPEGCVIRPGFVTGLVEAQLATRAAWRLTDLGIRVAGELRAYRARGGAFHHFVPEES